MKNFDCKTALKCAFHSIIKLSLSFKLVTRTTYCSKIVTKKFSPNFLHFKGTIGRQFPTVGCHLSPNCYSIDGDNNKIYNRVVSKRGPYDVFSEDRSQKQKNGHYATHVRLKFLYFTNADRRAARRLMILFYESEQNKSYR